MKKRTKFLTLSLIMLAFAASTFAQSATATATATILTPLSIANAGDMNFGNIVAGAGGDVTLDPVALTRTTTGPGLFGAFTFALFDVTGNPNSSYTISLPATHTITRLTGTETMVVDAFSSDPATPGTLSGTGTQTITVGATLGVGAAQVPGVYENAAGFTVTINYN